MKNEVADKATNNRTKAAKKDFVSGLACSQAVLAVFADRYGLTREQALRLAAGFEGGLGMQAEVCGALVGVYLVLGLEYGGIDPADLESKRKTAEKVQEATERFRERHQNNITCRDLLECDISYQDGLESAIGKRLFKRRCPHFVGDAVQIAEQLLPEE